jgi:dihydrofolate reductase
MSLSIIVASDTNGGIGYNNKLLFKIKEDMKRFKELTNGHTI